MTIMHNNEYYTIIFHQLNYLPKVVRTICVLNFRCPIGKTLNSQHTHFATSETQEAKHEGNTDYLLTHNRTRAITIGTQTLGDSNTISTYINSEDTLYSNVTVIPYPRTLTVKIFCTPKPRQGWYQHTGD